MSRWLSRIKSIRSIRRRNSSDDFDLKKWDGVTIEDKYEDRLYEINSDIINIENSLVDTPTTEGIKNILDKISIVQSDLNTNEPWINNLQGSERGKICRTIR